MAIISREEVLKLARISKLSIHDGEIEGITKQIEDVLSYAARVQEVKENVALSLMKNINTVREDVIIPTDPAPILAQAPEKEAGYFVVPAILEHK